MSYFILPAFNRCRIINKYNLEKCLHQLQSRLYYGKCESRRNNHGNGKERIPRRKVLKAKILRDFRETKEKVELYIEKENIWTIPNLLCISRIVTSPYLSYLIVSQNYQVIIENFFFNFIIYLHAINIFHTRRMRRELCTR